MVSGSCNALHVEKTAQELTPSKTPIPASALCRRPGLPDPPPAGADVEASIISARACSAKASAIDAAAARSSSSSLEYGDSLSGAKAAICCFCCYFCCVRSYLLTNCIALPCISSTSLLIFSPVSEFFSAFSVISQISPLL